MGFYTITRLKYKSKNITVALNFCFKESQHCPCPLCTELPSVPLQLLQAHSHPLPRGCSFLHELAAFPWNGQNALQLSNFPTTLCTQRERASLEHTMLTAYLPHAHEESNTANTRSSKQEILSFRKGYWKLSSSDSFTSMCATNNHTRQQALDHT